MKSRNKTCHKYLTHYAEPEVEHLASFPATLKYSNVIVIPAFQESVQFIERFLTSQLAEQNCLIIVVINQPDNNLGRQYQQNQITLDVKISQLGKERWQQGNLRLVDMTSIISNVTTSILIVNRFTQAIPEEQGVGLARKIGADLAVQLYISNHISSSWVHSTDADATLPNNYFIAHLPENLPKNELMNTTIATYCDFYHHSEQLDIHHANQGYEKALRYYVAGLQYAKSPYAYFTIGSILSFDIYAYCQARGFPKRNAGEDFYLLNKLAKLGSFAYLSNVTIKLDARPSQRVPFGTGPAVQRIMQLTAQGQEYYYYDPLVFIELKSCLSAFELLWQHREAPEHWFSLLSTISQQALKNIMLMSFIEKQKNSNQQQFNKQLIVWFDSFKTLKFIHALRELGLNDIPLKQALLQAPFDISIKANHDALNRAP